MGTGPGACDVMEVTVGAETEDWVGAVAAADADDGEGLLRNPKCSRRHINIGEKLHQLKNK